VQWDDYRDLPPRIWRRMAPRAFADLPPGKEDRTVSSIPVDRSQWCSKGHAQQAARAGIPLPVAVIVQVAGWPGPWLRISSAPAAGRPGGPRSSVADISSNTELRGRARGRRFPRSSNEGEFRFRVRGVREIFVEDHTGPTPAKAGIGLQTPRNSPSGGSLRSGWWRNNSAQAATL